MGEGLARFDLQSETRGEGQQNHKTKKHPAKSKVFFYLNRFIVQRL